MSYIRVRPTQLASAFAKADQAAHMIAVVLDQEAITSGAVRDGAPWKHYDLGHSYCSNAFWSTCPHRMACAGCFFNVPKQSAKGLILAVQQSAGRLWRVTWRRWTGCSASSGMCRRSMAGRPGRSVVTLRPLPSDRFQLITDAHSIQTLA